MERKFHGKRGGRIVSREKYRESEKQTANFGNEITCVTAARGAHKKHDLKRYECGSNCNTDNKDKLMGKSWKCWKFGDLVCVKKCHHERHTRSYRMAWYVQCQR